MWVGLLLLLSVFLSGAAEACQNFSSFVQNKQGVVSGGAVIATVDGVTISVYLSGTTTLATIYSDANCAVTVSNPLTSDTNGAFTFWATDGIYDLTYVKTGFNIPSNTNVYLFEPIGENVYLNAKYAVSDPCTAGTGALAQIGASNIRELVINKPFNCGTTAVSGTNITWNFMGAGSITVNTPTSLTINGPVKCAHGRTCFLGTATPVFGAGAGPTPYGQLGITSPTYGATVAIDASLGESFLIVATNGTAFTVSNPINVTIGKVIEIRFANTSGGAMGVVTMSANYLSEGAITMPATGKSRYIRYRCSSSTVCREIGRSTADATYP